jgi:hypothetical protein
LENLLSGGHKLITNSHMMPDTSPSTLFGDNWLTDVVARLLGHDQSTSATDDGAGDGDGEGVSYGGVFGETERWLWAAHYMVRTAELVLRDTEKGIFESAPAPPSPKRQLPAEQTPAPPDAATP